MPMFGKKLLEWTSAIDNGDAEVTVDLMQDLTKVCHEWIKSPSTNLMQDRLRCLLSPLRHSAGALLGMKSPPRRHKCRPILEGRLGRPSLLAPIS